MTDLDIAASALSDLMSEISEEAYCAMWMLDLEYNLWRIVQNNGGRYGYAEIDELRVAKLRELSARCGGWVGYYHESEETFVPLADWEEKYEKWLTRH